CGLPFKPGIDELEQAGLTALPARKVKPPRIAECRSHFECSVAWTRAWLHRLMVCGKVEAVSANADCVDPDGYIVWDRMAPAHYCGSRYGNRFVPVYDKPTEAFWGYHGDEGVFLEGEDWRSSFYRHLKKTAD